MKNKILKTTGYTLAWFTGISVYFFLFQLIQSNPYMGLSAVGCLTFMMGAFIHENRLFAS
ncbi:MAG: hypothetical protein HKN16_06780 [Saprospiraceae bacterium]|nr:hypothetical protein [Saprospiraceae bacterium]